MKCNKFETYRAFSQTVKSKGESVMRGGCETSDLLCHGLCRSVNDSVAKDIHTSAAFTH